MVSKMKVKVKVQDVVVSRKVQGGGDLLYIAR